jgi:2-C-methyl-D-erythritol 4-phosphate cytidylyltransferase
MNKYAVIVAGGSGTRMGSSLPKQYLRLNDQPILLHTLKAFVSAYDDFQVILVLPESYIEFTRAMLVENNFFHPIQFVRGGETRFHSVQNGLRVIKEDGIVFVHDAVRCLVSPHLIRRCYQGAMDNGSAIPVINLKDSVRILKKDKHFPIDRSLLKLVQTPQTFQTQIILPAFECSYHEVFTDEATVVEASGKEVYLIDGEETNIKITSPVDMVIAETYLNKKI